MIDVRRFTEEQRSLRRRFLDVIHREKLSHMGSCLSAMDIINAVYQIKRPQDRFVLSNGHAALALYVVLEKQGLFNLDSLEGLHIHPDRDTSRGIHVSTGSLGQGLPIALGMALADRSRDVYCMISDGESAEGSIWEALRVAVDQRVMNLRIVVNANGWAAYMPIDAVALERKFHGFGYSVVTVDGHTPDALQDVFRRSAPSSPEIILAMTDSEQFPFLKGLDAHYYMMTPDDYVMAKELLI